MGLQPTNEIGELKPQGSYELTTNFGNAINLQLARTGSNALCSYQNFDHGDVFLEVLHEVDFPQITDAPEGREFRFFKPADFAVTMHFVSTEGEYASFSFGNPYSPGEVLTKNEMEPTAEVFLDVIRGNEQETDSKSGPLERVVLAIARQNKHLYNQKELKYTYDYHTNLSKFLKICAAKIDDEQLMSLKANLADFEHFLRIGGDWKKFNEAVNPTPSEFRQAKPVNQPTTDAGDTLKKLGSNYQDETGRMTPMELQLVDYLFKGLVGMEVVYQNRSDNQERRTFIVNSQKYLESIFPEISVNLRRKNALALGLLFATEAVTWSGAITAMSGSPEYGVALGSLLGTMHSFMTGEFALGAAAFHSTKRRLKVINNLIEERLGKQTTELEGKTRDMHQRIQRLLNKEEDSWEIGKNDDDMLKSSRP